MRLLSMGMRIGWCFVHFAGGKRLVICNLRIVVRTERTEDEEDIEDDANAAVVFESLEYR